MCAGSFSSTLPLSVAPHVMSESLWAACLYHTNSRPGQPHFTMNWSLCEGWKRSQAINNHVGPVVIFPGNLLFDQYQSAGMVHATPGQLWLGQTGKKGKWTPPEYLGLAACDQLGVLCPMFLPRLIRQIRSSRKWALKRIIIANRVEMTSDNCH